MLVVYIYLCIFCISAIQSVNKVVCVCYVCIGYESISLTLFTPGHLFMKAMQSVGTPPFLLQLLRDLHNGTTSRVRVDGHLSASFITTSVVRQGCVLAPALFYRAIQGGCN